MITDEQKHEFYQALVDKDPQYDGTFFACIKTTGIFCHATCTARKPKYENCEFFFTAEEALLAGKPGCSRQAPCTCTLPGAMGKQLQSESGKGCDWPMFIL